MLTTGNALGYHMYKNMLYTTKRRKSWISKKGDNYKKLKHLTFTNSPGFNYYVIQNLHITNGKEKTKATEKRTPAERIL